MRYFDFEKVARESGIPKDKLAQLCQALRPEFPSDDLMYELHVLRVCLAIQKGDITLEEALQVGQAA